MRFHLTSALLAVATLAAAPLAAQNVTFPGHGVVTSTAEPLPLPDRRGRVWTAAVHRADQCTDLYDRFLYWIYTLDRYDDDAHERDHHEHDNHSRARFDGSSALASSVSSR